jgi:hypothetical protein
VRALHRDRLNALCDRLPPDSTIAEGCAIFSCVLLASDAVTTRVPFEQLAAFPALRDLSLQCNGLRHLANPDPIRGFAVLEVRRQIRACDTRVRRRAGTHRSRSVLCRYACRC